jgi:hypothetical protein
VSNADQWRWTDDEGVQRLLRGDELRAALTDGRLKPSTLVWKRGMKSWVPANEVRELRAFIIDDDQADTVTKEVQKDLGKKAVPTPSIPAPGIRSPANLVDINALRAAGVRSPVNTLVGVGEKGRKKKDSGARQEVQIPAAPKVPEVDGGWRDGAARRDRDEDTVTALVPGDDDDATLSEGKQAGAKPGKGGASTKNKTKKKKTVPPPRKRTRAGTIKQDKRPSRKPPPPVRARRTAPLGGAAGIKKTLKPKPPTPKPSVPPPVESSEVLSERFDSKKHASASGGSTLASADLAQQKLVDQAKKAVEQAVRPPPPAKKGSLPPPKKGSVPPPRRLDRSRPLGTGAYVESATPAGKSSLPPTPAGEAKLPAKAPMKTGPLPEDLKSLADPSAAADAPKPAPPRQPSQPAVAAQPVGPTASMDTGAGSAGIPTELPPKPPVVAGLTLKYPMVAGAGAAALLAVVLSFLVGRVSAPPSTAAQVVRAKTGWAVVPLFTRTRASNTPGPRPCLMMRAPSRFSEGATPRIPIEVATADERIAVGFAQSRTTPRGALVDPSTGKSDLVFTPEEPEDEGPTIERIVPIVNGGDVDFAVTPTEADGLYRSVTAPAATPFVVGFDSENVLKAPEPGATAQRMWSLEEGAGRADALRITTAEGAGFPLTYRQSKPGDKGFVYYAMLDTSGTIAHQALALAAPEGEVGKPKIAAGNRHVSVVYAHRQKVEGARWELRWARGLATEPLKDAVLVDIPAGGPGGDAGAPAITPLTGGRWLLMWMEGSRGAWTIRAQTYDRKYRPIGEALRVSPATGNFGQGVVGVVGEKAVVVFLLENAGNYELWGTVLQCQ